MTPEQWLREAVEHHQAGRFSEAEQIYLRLLTLNSAPADARHLLGILKCDMGCLAEGLELMAESIALQAQPRYFTNYSTYLLAAGRVEEAIVAARQAVWLAPRVAVPHYQLGVALQARQAWTEALAEYRAALGLDPAHAAAQLNVGHALAATVGLGEAIAWYREALRKNPRDMAMRLNLGAFHRARGEVEAEIETYRAGLAIEPNDAAMRGNLGVALKDQGEVVEAMEELRESLRLDPNQPETHSNLILTLLYLSRPDELAHELKAWNARFVAPHLGAVKPHANDRSAERRLRIGYVSPDFREHVVGRAFWPVFAEHDPRAVELVCYSSAEADGLNGRFRARADLWREMAGWSDERLAGQIRADGIDILVDLALHTAHHRLLTFARKPAPVQVSWLGYPGATGVETIDYRFTDPFLDPPGGAAEAAFERPLRLPETWTVYAPPPDAPEPNALPASQFGEVTFASFNNVAKLSDQAWDLWAAMLREVAPSRLMLLARNERHRERAREQMRKRGLDPERLAFLGYQVAATPEQSAASYLHRYHEVDIALDSYPYHGMTTTCEALWMGVPVVTLAGDTAVSRAGLSLLTNAGLPELVASSPQQYVQIATELARDIPRLTMLRSTLRGRLAASPLLDAGRLARAIEAAYREIWRGWMASAATSTG